MSECLGTCTTNTRRAWAEVDLAAIEHNRSVFAKAVGHDTRVMAVVKADAYGHGIGPVCRALARSEPQGWFGVATIAEAWAVREAAPDARIVILTATLPEDAGEIVSCRATPVLSDASGMPTLARAAAKAGIRLPVHIEVDTGMGRSGALPRRLDSLVEEVLRIESLTLEGLMTHFPNADGCPQQAEAQAEALRMHAERLNARFGVRVMLHAANSAAAIGLPRTWFDMVRPGMALYGMLPALSTASHAIALPTPEGRRRPGNVSLGDLRPALSLYAKVALVRDLPKGHAVSYGGTYVLERDARIATVSIGYGDGYPRALSNRGATIIRGRLAPIVGRVCMDQLMIDVSNLPDAAAGDVATLIGRDGDACIRAEELARLIGATEHEITTCLTSRVPRLYAGIC